MESTDHLLWAAALQLPGSWCFYLIQLPHSATSLAHVCPLFSGFLLFFCSAVGTFESVFLLSFRSLPEMSKAHVWSSDLIFYFLHWLPILQGKKKTNGSFKTLHDLTPAAAKSLQLCLTLCSPIDSSPPGSSIPGILQARTLEWVAISFSNAWKWQVKVKSLSRVRLLATPWTAAYQAPPSMGFSRQEYWSGVPLPSPKGMAGYI